MSTRTMLAQVLVQDLQTGLHEVKTVGVREGERATTWRAALYCTSRTSTLQYSMGSTVLVQCTVLQCCS